FLGRFAAATGATVRASVSRHRSGFTIGIGAAVDRVCHHAVDRRVAWPSPNDLPVAAPGWQIQTVLVKPLKRLPCAAQFSHFVEDQVDCLLHAAIRILLQPVAGLYEA